MNNIYKRMVVLASMGVAVLNMSAQGLDAWDDAWLNPPLSASPGCYYYWDAGNISKYGITKNLEAMKAIGIDEPFVANVVGKRAKQGPVKVFTEEWWDCMVHAANEAKRLGMHIGYFNCPGWSQSGGPWVKPTETMRYLVSRETRVSSGKKQLPPKTQAPELTWDVAYQKGELKAIGYNKGMKVSEDVLATAGKPAKILVHVSKPELKGDGMDLCYLDYTVVDAQGNICPDAVKLDFEVKGQGSNAGVANDDMMSDEPWQGNSRSTYRGKCQLIVRSNALAAVSGKNRKIGKIVVKAKSKGLKPLTTIITVK